MLLSLAVLFASTISVNGWWKLSDVDSARIELYPAMCSTVPGLTAKQVQMCRQHPDMMKHLVFGLQMALHECQTTFKHNVWNCTLDAPGIGTSPLKVGSRESAYVYAIAAAGISHQIAKACAMGKVEGCGCGSTPQGGSKDFIWAGCSDNVRYANNFGRKFIDLYDKQHNEDARSQMNLHNNRVGRRMLASNLNKECKCHGVSGSCVTKTCWKVVPRFDKFAAKLSEKYELAKQVTVSGRDSKLMVRSASQGGRTERYLKTLDSTRAMRNELIYLESSPNYCDVDVRDRECGHDCPNVCCGRGWRTTRQIVDEPCHCQFIWCCEVKCKTCKKIVEKNYCL